MHRLLFGCAAVLAFVVVSLDAAAVALAAEERTAIKPLPTPPKKHLTCSYTGDPHLRPFYDPYTQYWCKNAGWEVLVSNKYFTIYVISNPGATFPIYDFKLIFADSQCGMGTPTNLNPCAPGNSLVSYAASGNSHFYVHNGGEFRIKINTGGNFDFYISQTPKLVEESCGVCIRWNCPFEYAWPRPLPQIPEVCEIYVKKGQEHAIGAVDDRVGEIAMVSCINDLQATFNVEHANAALDLVLEDSIKELVGNGNVEEELAVLEKLEAVRQEASKDAATTATEAIAAVIKNCPKGRKCSKPLAAK